MLNLYGRAIFITLLGMFALIAGLTYHFGCEDGLRQDCVKYYVIRAPVVSYAVSTHTCQACNATVRQCRQSCSGKTGCHTSCTLICTGYRYFACYNSVAVLHYTDPVTDDCILPAAYNDPSSADAEAVARQTFPPGTIRTIYVDKDTHECSLKVDATELIRVAIAFFVLLCLTFLVWIAVELCLWKRPV